MAREPAEEGERIGGFEEAGGSDPALQPIGRSLRRAYGTDRDDEPDPTIVRLLLHLSQERLSGAAGPAPTPLPPVEQAGALHRLRQWLTGSSPAA